MPDTPPTRLVLPEFEISWHGPGNILSVCLRQWQAERQLKRRGVHFRSADPSTVAAAYQAMTAQEFDAVNGRQDWANWRTIPRCLNRHVAARPLRILDLGCGTGSSTRVLAFCAPAGSWILGYEAVEALCTMARRKVYWNRSGLDVTVDFRCQGMTETFCATDGSAVLDRTIDVVNASGVVGHHLNEQSVKPLITEVNRVLAPEGIAMLDVGPTLKEPNLTALMTAAGFVKVGHWRSCWLDPTGQVVYRRK
jgi:SAM-dependent methyltransferase